MKTTTAPLALSPVDSLDTLRSVIRANVYVDTFRLWHAGCTSHISYLIEIISDTVIMYVQRRHHSTHGTVYWYQICMMGCYAPCSYAHNTEHCNASCTCASTEYHHDASSGYIPHVMCLQCWVIGPDLI